MNPSLSPVIIRITEERQCERCGGSGTVTEMCASCNGSGTTESGEPCPDCGGSGIVVQTNTCPVCNGGAIDKQCEACGGTGQIKGDSPTCSSCAGSGIISIKTGQQGPINTGTTDTMPYHTGTMQTSGDTPGQGVQYRYIEDLWAGLFDYVDDIRFDNSGNVYITMNPNDYSDTEGGTLVGNLSNCITNGAGWIAGWDVPSVDGYSRAMLPIEGKGLWNNNETGKRISDIMVDNMSSNEINTLMSGGFYWRQLYHAGEIDLFCPYTMPESGAVKMAGVRLQKLP